MMASDGRDAATAAHKPNVTSTTTRRRDNGQTDNPTRFDFHRRSEPTTQLSFADQRIEPLRAYSDVVTFVPDQIGEDTDAITYIDIHASQTSADTVDITGVRQIDMTELFGGHLTDEQKFALERFFAERYDAHLDFDDVWEDEEGTSQFNLVQVGVSASASADISRQDAFDLIREHTTIDVLDADYHDLPKLFGQFLDTHAVITREEALREAESVTIEYLDTAMALRLGEREISDAQALATGLRMDPGTYEVWHQFGKTGVADKRALHDDLVKAYNDEWGRKKDWANMMFTYLLHGGDND